MSTLQVLDSEDGSVRPLHTTFAPQPPEALNLTATALVPSRVVDDHLQYREQLKLLVEIERLGSRFKEVVLLDPGSMLGNHHADPSRLFLSVTAYCAPCATTQASESQRRCDPLSFPLPPSVQGLLLAFDHSHTRFSRAVTLNIPRRYRRPSGDQWHRCGAESLVVSLVLKNCFGIVATFRLQTPLRARTHQGSQPHQAPVQQNIFALPQAISDLAGSTNTTALPPPPSPQIVDINPQHGPHFVGQRVWVKVQNLPQGNGQRYLIGFGHAGIVTTSFVSSEGDQVQILECTTPETPTSCAFLLSLMHDDDPQTPIAFGHIYYTFD